MMVDIKSKFFLSVMLFGSFVNLCASSAPQGGQGTVDGVVVGSGTLGNSVVVGVVCPNRIYSVFRRLNDNGEYFREASYFTDNGIDLRDLERVRFDGETYYRERAASVNGNDVKPSGCSVM